MNICTKCSLHKYDQIIIKSIPSVFACKDCLMLSRSIIYSSLHFWKLGPKQGLLQWLPIH